MTNSTSLTENKSAANGANVLNLLGVIAGATATVASIAALNPICFFASLAATFFCLDGVR